jgi:hypothetical protein
MDVSPDSHSTCTAGKAVGKKYGASKQDKLVVVQMEDGAQDDFLNALGLIYVNIRTRSERKRRAS